MSLHRLFHSILGLCLVGSFCQRAQAFLPHKASSSFGVKSTQAINAKFSLPLGAGASSTDNKIDNTIDKKIDQSDATDIEGQSMVLLNEAIGFSASAASSLLSDINQMRENDTQESIEDFLNNLLASGPDASLPFWARSKRLARYSRRARMASLRRTLDMTTPPPSAESEDETNKLAGLGRRRRSLVTLLRSLSDESTPADSKVPAIVSFERKAIEASREDATTLRSRLPEGLETPEYEILAKRDSGQKNVEIRRYKPYSVCAVSMNKPRPVDSTKTDATLQQPEMSGASSFGALAGYLFGKNDKSTAMKMTTPVFTSPGIDADEKRMEFILPSEYWENERLTTAPQPLSGSGVTLLQKESEERAVLMFGGYASKKEVQKRKKGLKAALAKDPEWKALDEEATLAQYNDPFTVPWRRLNEVSVKVIQK